MEYFVINWKNFVLPRFFYIPIARCVYLCLSVCLSVCLCMCVHICGCPSVAMCMSVCVPVCLASSVDNFFTRGKLSEEFLMSLVAGVNIACIVRPEL